MSDAAPDFLIEAARNRRRRPAAREGNWVTDPSLPMGWAGDAVESFARRINAPLHSRMTKRLERIGEVEINAGSGTG
jgi:hypothetical protein